LQVLRDRGELKDWFESAEIRVEAAVFGLALYLFIVHTSIASERSFLNRDMLKDRNLVVGTLSMLLIGIPLYGSMALLPTLLQGLLGYPVLTTGPVMVPRGIGSMIGMLLVTSLSGLIEGRLIIPAGLVLTIIAMWQMTVPPAIFGTPD